VRRLVDVERDPLDARWCIIREQERMMELREQLVSFLDRNASNLGCRRVAHNTLIRKSLRCEPMSGVRTCAGRRFLCSILQRS